MSDAARPDGKVASAIGILYDRDPAALAAFLKDDADGFVHRAGSMFNIKEALDFSPRSLQVVDQALATFHPDGFAMSTSAGGYAAYVGEVIRRHLGGTWEVEGEDGDALPALKKVPLGGGAEANLGPFLWVLKAEAAMREGSPVEAPVAGRYALLLEKVGRADEIPEPLPPDFVADLAKRGGEYPGPRPGGGGPDAAGPAGAGGAVGEPRATSDGEKAEALPPDRDAAGPALSAETRAEALRFGPLCYFVLAAVTDGTIDDEELDVFAEHLEELTVSSNPLTATVAADALEHADADAKLLIGDSGPTDALGLALHATLKLAACRIVAEDYHPEHAAGFLGDLQKLAEAVAGASGGASESQGRLLAALKGPAENAPRRDGPTGNGRGL